MTLSIESYRKHPGDYNRCPLCGGFKKLCSVRCLDCRYRYPETPPTDDPAIRNIALDKGFVALVDASDYAWLNQWKWRVHIGKSGYVHVVRSGKNKNGVKATFKMHRQILGLENGDPAIVDHVNQNTLDNRRSNLRICTHSQNHANTRLRKDSTTGFKGVCLAGSKFRAAIRKDGKSHHLGVYNTAQEAAEAYRQAAIRMHGEFARFE